MKKRGFTLVEMIIAIFIFAIVALVSTSTLLLLNDAQKKAFALRNVYDSMRFSLEILAKDIRTGTAFHCGSSGNLALPQDCAGGASAFTYTSSGAGNPQVTYALNNGRIQKSVGAGAPGDVTLPEVVIDDLRFIVMGSGVGDTIQPRVAIIIIGHVGAGRRQSKFNLQTTITQRKVF